MNDSVVISDIHLGSGVCQAKKVRDFLLSVEHGSIPTKEIIINGDLFDSWDFRKLKGSHWKVLSQMRSLSKSKHIVWINGNHDGPAEIISHLIGVEFVEEYMFESGGKKILALHGDRFDNVITRFPMLTKFADNAYRMIQRIDKSFYLAKLAKNSSKTFMRCSEQIKQKAKAYAQRKGADAVLCGHTHLAVQDRDEVEYHNSGCWTEHQCHYIEVKNGEIALRIF